MAPENETTPSENNEEAATNGNESNETPSNESTETEYSVEIEYEIVYETIIITEEELANSPVQEEYTESSGENSFLSVYSTFF